MNDFSEKIADALYYLNDEDGGSQLSYSDYLTKVTQIIQHTGLQDEIIQLREENKKLCDAINNCIDYANGRESEWGSRAESAFQYLYDALDIYQ